MGTVRTQLKHKENIIMRKLLIAIACIALAIALLGCDEKKAKDAIKKAIDKTVADKAALQTEIKKAIQEHGNKCRPKLHRLHSMVISASWTHQA